MPVRRGSSAAHNVSGSSSRVHRSNGSNHSVLGPSSLAPSSSNTYVNSIAPATPQQKVVSVLVNRLKNKLPCNSGIPLVEVEADDAIQQVVESLVELSQDALDIIGWALTELLEKLAKQTDMHGYRSIDVLQSQLFVLKVLAICMASRWGRRQDGARPSSRNSKQMSTTSSNPSIHESSSTSSHATRRQRGPSEQLSLLVEPPPLDDNCAKYILSVMVLLLRETAPPKYRLMSSANMDFAASHHDFESVEASDMGSSVDLLSSPALPASISPIPRMMSRTRHASSTSLNSTTPSTVSFGQASKHSLMYERTSIVTSKSISALNTLVAKFAGRVVYHLSASNWNVVLSRVRQKIHFLASTTESDPEIVDLQLMVHSAVDRGRLVQALQELSSLLLNMKHDAQAAIAIPLRAAIWNWIDMCPEEYNDTIRYHRRMEGAPERVFDILFDFCESQHRVNVWPTLAALACISSERIRTEYQANSLGMPRGQHGRRDRNFYEMVMRSLTSQKVPEEAIVCALDLCRAAFRIRPEDGAELAIHLIAHDIAHDLRSMLASWNGPKPFYEHPEEIDVALIADILVTMFRYLPAEDVIHVFTVCLEPERSDAVKISAIKACITLVNETIRCPWQAPLDELRDAVTYRLFAIYQSTTTRRSEIDKHGNVKTPSLRPKAKRYTSETLPDRELLTFSLLALYRAVPEWVFGCLQESYEPRYAPITVESWRTPMDPAIKIAMARTARTLYDAVSRISPDNPAFPATIIWMKYSAPATLAAMCTNLIDSRTDLQAQRMWINMAYEVLYRFVRQTNVEHMRECQLTPERLPAFAVAEIAFLVSLTSADANVTLTAAHCLRLLAQAETAPNAPVSNGVNEDERVKRYPIYERLGDPKVLLVGRIGHQRRVRKLMRLMPSSSPVHLGVWQECYFRWCTLHEIAINKSIESTANGFDSGTAPIGDRALSAEEGLYQWQNLTLFLAAFGSACLRDQLDPEDLSLNIASEYLADQMRNLRDPTPLLSHFIQTLLNLLLHEDIHVRDTARDALGNEASPRLYTRIFKELDNVVRLTAEGDSVDWDSLAIFVDQFLAILKVLVENVQCLEEIRGMDLCCTLSLVAGFIGRFHDSVAYRLRIKFCSMCEAVFDQAETITMRKDNGSRQKIADIIIEWIQDPALCDRDFLAAQRDLNLSAFRASVKLFDRLQLQPPEGTSGEEAAHVVSRLFIRYSTVLFKAWESARSETFVPDDRSTDKSSSFSGVRIGPGDSHMRELVITGLASLVSANPEVGVKHTLPLAYETDITKRIIFSYVFARVLPQGITLVSQDHKPTVHRQSRLCELVKGPDLSLALAICEVCPPAEVDNLIPVMLNLFDTRTSLMALLKSMIDLEVARTDSDTSLFRGNSTCTRFLSAFANIYGYNYLRSLIIPLVKTMTSMPAGHGYDLDPSKVGEQAAKQNQANIQLVTSSFLEIIISSSNAVPMMLREICAHIAKVVNEQWPEAKFAAVGAFMFLRFISPAIVAPETVDVEIPRDDFVIRRGLMLVAKIIQNLANNILFGKEAHMIVLNDFLLANIMNVTRFLSDLNRINPSGSEEEPEEWLDTSYDDTDTIMLQRFFEKYADKVGKELLSLSKPPAEKGAAQTETSSVHGKRIWDALCAALVELGQPLEGPRMVTISSRMHAEYLDLMSRYEHRDTSPVRELFTEVITMTPQNPVMFVLSASKIDVEVLDIELLLFYIFKTLTSPKFESRDFDLIVDFTCFTLGSQIPIQWLKFAYEVIPADIRARFRTAHILTPNALALKYIKRLCSLSSGAHLSANYLTYSSMEELSQRLPVGSALPSLTYALSLEEEPCTRFEEVTMRHTHPMRVPVILEVAQSHLRITTVKAQLIGGSTSCKTTEIIPLTDINDVYSVSAGHDTHEFIIRKIRHGVTLYFSSSIRETIVKAIRGVKGNMRTVQFPGAERLSRFSNVAATLLHVGMLGVSSGEEELRIAANELLQAVCTYLDFEGKPLVTSKTSLVHGIQGPLLVQLSEALAAFAPHLALDFITEVSTNMSREPVHLRVVCIHYMAPWVKHLVCFTDPANKLYEPSTTKFRDCVRTLVDLTMADDELHYLIQKHVWTEVGKLDSSVVNAVLDELMRAAVDGGADSARCDRVADTVGAISSINVRGRILSRLRKTIGKSSANPTRSLADNPHWNEICCLIRLALVAGHHCRNIVHSQLFVPEIVHLVVLTAAIGRTRIRITVYGVVINLLNSQYTARLVDDTASPEIQALLSECEQPETLRLFGLRRPTPTSDYVNQDPSNDKQYIDTMESMVRFLSRVLETIAGTKGLLNVWRARWMSLITSSAFQLSPAVQTRAFVALGILATSDVDDDLLYQMLVAFKTALAKSSENDTTSVVSMLRCIRNVVPALPRNSRYLCQLFWLAVALLQSGHMLLYEEAIHLLRVTLEVMNSQDAFKDAGVSATLLDGRVPLEEVACQLDRLLGLSFESSFSFSLASIIFKGLRHAGLKESAETALRSLVTVTVKSCSNDHHADDGPGTPVCPDVLGYFVALLPTVTTTKKFKRLLEECQVDESWLKQDFLSSSSDEEPLARVPFALLGLSDSNTALFVTSLIGAMLTSAQGDDAESQVLYNILSDVANAFPDIVSLTYESLQDKIKEAFANSSSPGILSAVSNLFRVAVHDSDNRASAAGGSASSLSIDDAATHGPGRSHLFALEEQSMQGLANSFQFLPANQGHATKMINWISELVMKIIE